MSEVYSFDESKVSEILEAHASHEAENRESLAMSGEAASAGIMASHASTMALADCVAVVVSKAGKVCIKLPLGLGTHCIPIPTPFPPGTAGKACLSIKTKWGIPCGVEVTISFGGVTVIKKSFGLC